MWHADQLTAFFVSLPCWHVEKTPAGPNSVMCLLCFGVSGISWCSPVGAGRGQGGAVSGRPELLGAWRCSPGAPSQLTPVSLTRPPPRLTGSEVWREAKRGGLAVCLLWVRSPWQLPTKNCGALSTLPLYYRMKETELYWLGSGENTDYRTLSPALLLTTCEDFALFQVQFSHGTH